MSGFFVMKQLGILFFLLLFTLRAWFHHPQPYAKGIERISEEIYSLDISDVKSLYKFTASHKQLKRNALLLAVLTGPLGGHRILLGTKPIVPVIYTVTLGGGFFILPLMDIISILSTNDLTAYLNNEQVVMWIN